MTDLRTRAISALSGACWPDNEAREQTIARVVDFAAAFASEQIELDARLAETRHSHWRMPHPDDARPSEVCDDVTACQDIAAAIRARRETNNEKR